MQNPPSIPLWGVMSLHPETILFRTWQQEALSAVIPAEIWERAGIGQQEGCWTITCARHTDLATILQLAPSGECVVLPVKRARLMAEPLNKLSGIDHYFGMNGVGDLPRCSKHMETQHRDITCVASVEDEKRELKWWCNECHDHCEIKAPKLEEATDMFPDCTFDKHNTIPAEYNTHLQEKIEREDLEYMIRTLPLRRAPGPDGIPNEVLRCLPMQVIDRMYAVINEALTKGTFPVGWKDCVVTLMTKKPPAELLSNQRPVALCNTTYKLFSYVVNDRLTTTMEENGILENEQEGARSEHNTL
jgi:hypothetical protein